MTIKKTLMIAAAWAITAGCADLPPAPKNPWELPQSSWSQVKEGLRLDFTLKPPSPDEAQEAELELSVTDLTASPPVLVTGAEVKGKALMPRRPGHIHVLALQALHKENTPGVYGMHLAFGMGGEWEAKFAVTLPDGRVVEAVFPFIVSGSDVPPWERKKVKSK